MLAYCTALQLDRGFLIYAKDAGQADRRHQVRNANTVIHVKVIDVELEPNSLLVSVDALAREIASAPT